jgi:release factor glutamine methyltransferase
MDYRSLYQTGIDKLERAGIAEAKLDARLLLEYACGTDHSTLLAHPDREVTASEQQTYEEYISRREKREPVAYILGTWDFMGLSFEVCSDVLIPEQDSEFLVEEAMRYCEDGMRVLDLCAGSGCIGLSILNFTNETTLLGTDISEAALKVAEKNAEKLGLKDRATFVKTDLFPDPDSCGGKFDVIVSNPPYIPTKVIEGLAPEVKDFEPRIALDGDEDGLTFYRRIIQNTEKYLFTSGYLIMEIGYDQAEAVTALLNENGRFHEIEVIKDFGGNDRVVRACFY